MFFVKTLEAEIAWTESKYGTHLDLSAQKWEKLIDLWKEKQGLKKVGKGPHKLSTSKTRGQVLRQVKMGEGELCGCETTFRGARAK